MSGRREEMAATMRSVRREYVFDEASFTGRLLLGCVDGE
jgi:hypothetical protein